MERVAPRSSMDIGQNAAEIVAPEWNVIGPDTAGIGDALMAALGGAATNPADLMKASTRLSSDLARIPPTVLSSWFKKQKGDDKGTSDRRFADPAWTDNPYFHAVRLACAAQCEFARGRSSGRRASTPSRRLSIPWARPLTRRDRAHQLPGDRTRRP